MPQCCPAQTISMFIEKLTPWGIQACGWFLRFSEIFDCLRSRPAKLHAQAIVNSQPLFSLQAMHTRPMTGCGSAKIPQTNIHPKCPIMLVLLLFLPVSFILATASGTCLDLIPLGHAHSVPDCKSADKNGPYKRYQQAQSE